MNSRLYEMIGREDFAEDPRFHSAMDRWHNRQAYYEIIRDAFLAQPSDHWLNLAKAYDLPMIRMGLFSDLSTDEQAWANGYLERVEFASGNTDVMPRSPIEMESVGELKTVPAPGIGADSVEVLKQLGYTDTQLKNMAEAGAIAIGEERKK
jgi:crotonobetainyl-CoA:carnitine CoA-transferase CaiB-like acyl-CoA transferase